MAQKLAAELGIAVGISSGANFLANAQAQDELGDDAVVATVFADDSKKYFSTDVLRYEPHQVALPRSRSHPDRLSHRPSRLQRVR
jgi:cysteine synthase A